MSTNPLRAFQSSDSSPFWDQSPRLGILVTREGICDCGKFWRIEKVLGNPRESKWKWKLIHPNCPAPFRGGQLLPQGGLHYTCFLPLFFFSLNHWFDYPNLIADFYLRAISIPVIWTMFGIASMEPCTQTLYTFHKLKWGLLGCINTRATGIADLSEYVYITRTIICASFKCCQALWTFGPYLLRLGHCVRDSQTDAVNLCTEVCRRDGYLQWQRLRGWL